MITSHLINYRHPFDSSKWGRICQFLVSAGILDKRCIVEPEEASREDLLVVVVTNLPELFCEVLFLSHLFSNMQCKLFFILIEQSAVANLIEVFLC